MNPKMDWSNLVVSDLERTTKFYTALGFKSNGKSKELTSFFFGEDNFVVHFFLKEIIEANVKTKFITGENGSEIIFTLSAENRDEVDRWAKEVVSANGRIVSGPEEFGEGYYGFVFADPDGHKFNVFFM